MYNEEGENGSISLGARKTWRPARQAQNSLERFNNCYVEKVYVFSVLHQHVELVLMGKSQRNGYFDSIGKIRKV